MANQLRNRYDIIINGGGIVGFTLLNLIQKSPHLSRCKVLLIEQASKPSGLKQPKRCLDSSSNSVSDQATPDSLSEPIFSNRVSSITLKSKNILKRLGVWSEIERYAKDVNSIKVWNYNYSNKMIFNQDDEEESDGRRSSMFSVVENNRLSLSLLNNICKNDEEAIKWENNLTHMERSLTDGLIDITTRNDKSNEEFNASAPLVLGCDGFKSKVRQFAQMKYSEVDLHQSAVVGTVRIETDFMNPDKQVNDIAFQRFSPENDTVAALLPVDEKYSSFVISAPTDYAKHLMDCDDDSFVDEFNELLSRNESPGNFVLEKIHDISNLATSTMETFINTNSSSFSQNEHSNYNFGPDVEPPKVISIVKNSRASFPLVFGTTTPKMIASLQFDPDISQIALLGDSSHRIHPLAGQGLNLGIQDACELVEQLEAISKCGERVFDDNDHSMLAKALRRYQLKRQAFIIPMSLGILSMPYLFRLAPPSLISTFDKLSPLKRASVRFANGL